MINEYIHEEMIEEMQKVVSEDKSIKIAKIFDDKSLQEIKEQVNKLKFEKVKHPIEHSYSFCDLDDEIMDEITSFVSKLLKKDIKPKYKVYKLEWKDYSILNDESIEDPGTDIVLDLTEAWNPESGGNIVYSDGEGNYAEFPAEENMLAVYERDEKDQKFFQYVNHKANGVRLLIMGVTKT
jgi:hypothetical protein